MKNHKCPQQFLKEWKILSKGIPFKIESPIGMISGSFIFEEGNYATISSNLKLKPTEKFKSDLIILLGTRNIRNYLINNEDLNKYVTKTSEYKLINERIKRFIKEIDTYSKINFGDKYYLWERFFW